ncbi:MAG: hypothetical protein R2795_14985 [Saprospiraceae bacterium]
MEIKQIRKLMSACGYFDYGIDKISLLEMSLQRDSEFTLENLRSELKNTLDSPAINWVDLAIDTGFVYGSNEITPTKLTVGNLLVFTDSFRWKDIVKFDAVMTVAQKDKLKEQFQEIGVQHFKDIYELIEHQYFDWLPFEVKHSYKQNFKEVNYVDEDIIFHLKNTVWEYLFPNSLNIERLTFIRREGLQILREQKKNQGWMDMSNMILFLKDCCPGLDLYELSRVEWGKDVEYKIHYRNPFTLGFKRVSPLSVD